MQSFDNAARALRIDWDLASLDGKQVQRWGEAMGSALTRRRDREVQRHREGVRPQPPANPPQLLVIGIDGGRYQGRDVDPDTQSRWREDKVLLTVSSYLPGDGAARKPQLLVSTHVATARDAAAYRGPRRKTCRASHSLTASGTLIGRRRMSNPTIIRRILRWLLSVALANRSISAFRLRNPGDPGGVSGIRESRNSRSPGRSNDGVRLLRATNAPTAINVAHSAFCFSLIPAGGGWCRRQYHRTVPSASSYRMPAGSPQREHG